MTKIVHVPCEVYWGSHGCNLERGHEGHHLCDCECENHLEAPEDDCVCAYPYYGPDTYFYGDDA